MKKPIHGAGGGGKGGGGSAHIPTEATDTLRSASHARLIDLISEGEIEGLVDGMKSIYLDGTPLQASNDTMNFKGVTVDTRNGTQDQEYIVGFSAAENEVQVGVEIEGTPIVRTITDASIDAVRVRVSIPQLTEQNTTTGDLTGSRVEYKIELQSDSGGYVLQAIETVIGKSVSKYERETRVELIGSPPWDIRVTRETAVSATVAVQNRTVWESYTEVVDGKFRYPNSALVAIQIDASQFSSIPTRGYDMKLLRIQVPSNYTVSTRAYSGSWDGTFQIAWSDNPAWILYDLMTTERYGLGAFISADQVDKWSLYEIAQYCDELVDDGLGGTEPRFTCNAYLQTRTEAFKVLQDLASCFRGMGYWSAGTMTFVQDAPSDSVHLFTPANVIDGLFTYSGSSAKARHTVALVTWNDPEDLYRQKIEYVEDDEGIARYGVIETQVSAFGCTSRGQANRVGRWLLYSEQYQTEVVAFKVGLEGSLCRPGEVVEIADPVRAGTRRGGRIVSATTSSVFIDDATLSINPATHTVTVLLTDGSIEERQLIVASGGSLIVGTPFSSAPQPGSVWVVSSTDVETQLFKIVGVREDQGGTYEITAIAHDPDKYDIVEDGVTLEPRSISSLSAVPEAPKNIAITETLYQVNGDVRVKVTISWDRVTGAQTYIAQYTRDTGNLVQLPSVVTNEVEVFDAEPGTYVVKVYALTALGSRSVDGTYTKRIVGKAIPPSSVSGFSLMPSSGMALLSWTKSTDLDVLIGGSVRIRYTPETATPLWRNAVDITAALAGSSTRAQVPLLNGSYMAKFVDSSGNSSVNESLIITTIPEAQRLNVVETITESPTFAGTKTDMEVSGVYGGLALTAASLIDDVLEDIDDVGSIDYTGGVIASGTYEFDTDLDLGAVYTSRVTASISAEAVDVSDEIDTRQDDIDDWQDLDSASIDDVNVEVLMRTTEDDPADLGAVWTDWKRFFVGEYKARGFKFKIEATSTGYRHNIVITDLEVVVDMPDRVENFDDLVSGTSTYSVLYNDKFHEAPAVGIMAQNMNSGDYYVVSNKTRSGFDILFKNSGGTNVSRTFDVIAKGYGREV